MIVKRFPIKQRNVVGYVPCIELKRFRKKCIAFGFSRKQWAIIIQKTIKFTKDSPL